MYKVLKENSVLAVVGSPTWVRLQENGSYGLTIEANAQGIAVDGTVYHVSGHPALEGAETVVVVEVDDGQYANCLAALVLDPLDLKNAEQFRKELQHYAASLDEETALVIATVYDPYRVGEPYAVGDYITYGTNNVGDPQLYKVIQAHTSQSDWPPDQTAALYSPVGLDESGYAVWSQPISSADAYNAGDIVSYNGTLYRSLIDSNVWSPEAYPAGWEVYVEG